MFTGEHLVLLDGDDHGSVLWVTASMLDAIYKHTTQRQQLCKCHHVISQNGLRVDCQEISPA